MSKKITTEIFIERAKQVHGDKYDYSKVDYKKASEKVCIICPEHGEFWQIPNNHWLGQGCPNCCKNKKLDTKSFIKKAQEKYGNMYDYSKVQYVDAKTKVCIICPEHGEFWQAPAHHLHGNKCPKCFGTHRKTTDEFIKEAMQIHGNRYDYSETVYGKNINDPVKIICKIHGPFWQTPVHHINSKCGCPKCNRSHGEAFLANYFENNNIEYKENYIVEVPIEIKPTGIIKVDFYLPKFNTFVEYNGKQHYIMQEGFGGQLKFDKQVQRDKYLRKYCKENNINLIEIPYTEKDIENYLINKINECNDNSGSARKEILETSNS